MRVAGLVAVVTEMAAGNKVVPHLAYYESLQGLPLVGGPFPNYDTAWRYLDEPQVEENLYDRVWVSTHHRTRR